MISGVGSNYGMVIMRLKPWDERTGQRPGCAGHYWKNVWQNRLVYEMQELSFLRRQPYRVLVHQGGFEFQLQDRSGGDIANFSKVSTDFLAALNQAPGNTICFYFIQSKLSAIPDRCKRSKG